MYGLLAKHESHMHTTSINNIYKNQITFTNSESYKKNKFLNSISDQRSYVSSSQASRLLFKVIQCN